VRAVLGAIGRTLAAMAALIVVWCEQLCRFVIRCLPGYQPATTADLVEAYTEAAHEASVEPSVDGKIARMQQAADLMFRQQPVPGDVLQGLSPKSVRWLSLLDADMLIAVARARPDDLREHLQLRQQIRGLLRFEDDAIAEYERAVEADAKVPKNQAARRTREQAFSLPAFGPIA